MLSLTHNDYFTTSGTGDFWTVHIKKCQNKIVETYHNELIRAAKIIYENASSPITLMYSGGLDGEFMLNIFRKANIPYKVAIISYGKYNDHDTKYAYDLCNNRNITPIVVDVDIEKFIESGQIYQIAKEVKCAAYQMPSIMHGIEKLDGTIVMANGEPYLKNYDGNWKYEETERVNSYMHWYTLRGIDGTPDFLRYTAESTLAFLKENLITELVENKHPGKLSTRTSKHALYSQNYNFTPRPKYTGWEEIEKLDLFDSVYRNFRSLRTTHNGNYSIDVSTLIQMLHKDQT
jgi:hypothetical protein